MKGEQNTHSDLIWIALTVSTAVAPSRLVLLLPTSSELTPYLITSSTSTTLTSLIVHPPEVVSVLSSTYLFAPPISGNLSEAGTAGGSRFRGLLENATKRNENLRLGLSGEAGTIIGDWVTDAGPSSHSATASHGSVSTDKSSASSSGVAMEVLVRKAAGGASKGMLRSLEGLRAVSNGKGKSIAGRDEQLETCRWQDIKALESLAAGYRSAQPDAVSTDKPKEEGKVCHGLWRRGLYRG
jgi:hypothetical protein